MNDYLDYHDNLLDMPFQRNYELKILASKQAIPDAALIDSI